MYKNNLRSNILIVDLRLSRKQTSVRSISRINFLDKNFIIFKPQNSPSKL
ncbi:hypothetical protein LCDVSa158R [Lymphocystis disease virus 3]|uniref:Uncharacterized protein n=1 Tax=Lymphocystis disease virus 3 TaxID=2560566 RepID=A0A1B2RW63_9VIRU|nr:hypothetical protein BZK12_gp158 [Lymphocystis disease virus Sa]AOC55242.1 hypothetical protein LCDVSa158R [Lymphocystis disease virus 3]